MDALRRAIKACGTQQDLADAIGVTQAAISNMLRRGKVDARAIITHRGTLDEGIALFERQSAYRDGVLKSAIYPNGMFS